MFSLLVCLSSSTLIFSQELHVNGKFELKFTNKDLIYLSGEYLDSVPNGIWTYYSDEAPYFFRTSYTYKNGVLDGEYKETMSNGVLLQQGSYLLNQKHGTWFNYNVKGEISEIINYKRDTLHGFYYNSQHSLYFSDGKLNGPVVYRNHENYRLIEGNYLNGLRDGRWIYHNRNGRTEVVVFENDTLNGPYYIYENANTYYGFDSITERGHYLKNKLHGLQITTNYYLIAIPGKGHSITTEKTYVNGVEHGIRRAYKQKDRLISECHYANGKRVGYCNEWTDSGLLTRMHYYDDTEEYDSFIGIDFVTGLKSEEYVRKKAFSSGQYHKVYPAARMGMPYADSFYIADGNRIFDHYTFDNNGRIISEFHIQNGKKTGRWFRENRYDLIYHDNKIIKTVKPGLIDDDFGYWWKKYYSEYSEVEDKVYGISEDYFFRYKDRYTPEFDYRLKRLIKNDVYFRQHPAADSKNINPCIQRFKTSDSLNLKGKVVFNCHVGNDGMLSGPKLIQSLHPLYDAEALRCILMYSRNVISNGLITPCRIEVTVEF